MLTNYEEIGIKFRKNKKNSTYKNGKYIFRYLEIRNEYCGIQHYSYYIIEKYILLLNIDYSFNQFYILLCY